jgi:hypothetical protein
LGIEKEKGNHDENRPYRGPPAESGAINFSPIYGEMARDILRLSERHSGLCVRLADLGCARVGKGNWEKEKENEMKTYGNKDVQDRIEVAHRDGFVLTLEVLPDDIPIEGNAMASGDDAVDRRAEQDVIDGLAAGNEWAWCTVRITAEHLDSGVVGESFLGTCSYDSEEDFMQVNGYAPDMIDDAVEQCKQSMANAALIAAAPELLMALRCALADLEGIMPEMEPSGDRNHPAWTTITEAQDAIAKAEVKP